MSAPRATNPSNASAASPMPASAKSARGADGPAESSSSKSAYQRQCEADNPAPTNAEDNGALILSRCRFVTAPDQLRLNEPSEFSVELTRSGKAVSKSPSFSLYCTRQRDGKEERDRIWAGVEGKLIDPKADPVVFQGKDILAAQADFAPGEAVTFSLEATHPDADEPAMSEPMKVSLKTMAHWVGGDDLFFRTDGEIPLLGADAALVGVLAGALQRVQKHPHPEGETVVCFGFASASGAPGPNRSLSRRRAQAVKALLDRDADAWDALARSHFEIQDIQQFLSDLQAARGWDIDPGAVDGIDGPKTRAAIEAFQRECNTRWKLGLREDGVAGPKTWAAVRRVLSALVQDALGEDPSKEPSWKKPRWGHGGSGVYANGEDFATGGDKPEERSVQITFFAPGSEPPLKDAPGGEAATTKENPVQEANWVEKRKLPTLEQQLATPKKGPVIHVGIFFDGTDNNRDRDRPKGHDTNISKLYDLFHHDDKTRYKFYFEGVATGDWKESDFPTGGLFGRGIAGRVRRAWARLESVAKRHPDSEIRLSLFGFSRGAATVLAFINHILAPSKILPSHLKAPFDKIWFVGIFDAVGSVGIPGDSDEGDHDLHALKSRIRTLAHLVARDERRLLFPLTSVRSGSNAALPGGWSERTFPGVHSDVGGGYKNGEHYHLLPQTGADRDHTQVQLRIDKRDLLSRIAGWAMYDAAVKAGVPMHSVKVRDAAPADVVALRLFSGEGMSHETPEYGWTLFKQADGADQEVGRSLERLAIHPSLLPLWKARNESAALAQLIDPRHPDYTSRIAPYIHDSMDLKDPRGIGRLAGIAPGNRNIFYRGRNT